GAMGFASPSPPTSLLSEPLSRMDVLSEKIWDYHNKVSQTDEMLQRKLHLRDMLYTAISPVFPLSGLYVVGSSLNGFGNNSSDMDLCLMITNKDLDQKNDAVVVLNLILSTLQYEKFVESQKLILAKVPILRINFAAPFDDITVDLNANNSVAIRNTHLLCYYSSYDWRVRPLVSVVKEWAKRKGINDANKSSFTSYSLVLMVIHFLQCGPTKVLPNLQQSYPNRFSNKVDVRTLNVTMALEEVADDIDQSLSEKTTLGELLIGFLDYYANEFNYDRDAISIRQGRRVEGTPGIPMHHSISNPHFWRSQWRCVCIEEPFTNSNTAHSIYDEMVFEAIKKAFREAHGELQHNHDLDKLMECEPIKA
uniref:Poly(A) RNA polymerase gld-2 n=1 Tax=Caenorhabditis elegans TaxID=6239 RepID=UPI00065B45E0